MLGSDHIPIIIELQLQVARTKATKLTYVTFAKANWEIFKTQLDDLVAYPNLRRRLR